MNSRLARCATLAAMAAILLAATAWAHPKLVRSRPAPNAQLIKPPDKVQIWFHEELDTKGSRLTVWNQDNQQVDQGTSRVSLDDRKRIDVGLKPLDSGQYTVKWRAMADDDKEVTQGEFRFSLAPPRQ